MSAAPTTEQPVRMTRHYAAARLLALGPLTFRDFHIITGWPFQEAQWVLAELVRAKVATYRNRINQEADGREYYLARDAS
jgi:hypothetical protein